MTTERYEDYKYVMQDTTQLYLGAKYTLQEMTENEEIPFKFRLILERYVSEEVSQDTTLESHLYYLTGESRNLKIYDHIKMKVRFLEKSKKDGILGKNKREYVTQVLPIKKFAEISAAEKERRGIVIQEISVSKLALMTF